ncbi:MAG: hypothetical protein IPH51_12935 [Rubrivivax sp.]|nr:hypothetical protein [Rubrivivax sp.]
MNLALWLYRNALAQGSRPAVALGCETVYDYAAFAHAACGFADWARQQGLQAGDRVGLFADNRPDLSGGLVGAVVDGCGGLPMNARLHGREAG